MAMRIRLQTRVHFRPNRSASTPKMRAPRDRKSRVRVMAVVMCLVLVWNCSASRETVRDTAKKS